MKSRKWITWVLAGIMMLPGAGLGEKKPNAVKTKQILRTWLCAGEKAPVRKSPKENAEVLWTLETDRMYQTDRHVDQYYQLTNEDGRTGYVSKGAVRICNAKDMTAGIIPIANGLLGPFATAVFSKGFPDIKGAFLPFFIISVVGWIIGLVFIRDYPEECGAYRDNDRSMTPEIAKAIMEQEIENKRTSVWTYLHTIKCKEFWFGTICVALLLSCSIGLMSQSNAIITAYPELNYTTVMALVMIFGCIGSFVLGVLDQKLGTRKAMIISACLMIIGGVLGLINNGTALMIAMIFVAMFMGASSNFGVSHAAQYWRREDFSRIFTLSSPIGSAISSASPAIIAALLFGATDYKGHAGAFTFVLISGVVALVVMLLHKPSHIKEMDDRYRAAAGKPLDDELVDRK